MRKLVTLTAALSLMGGMAMADPLLGTWRTAKDDNGNSGLIQVSQCGNALCGKLVKSYDANGKEKDAQLRKTRPESKKRRQHREKEASLGKMA